MSAQERFDYVIVGAGAAGCVLANRLSADSRVRVLLIEAGGKDDSILLKIPAGFSKLMGTKYNWIFDTVPQKHMDNRRMFLPQGKGLGGSTSINAMLYVRGNRGDYDQWLAMGNTGWGYDDVLPYYKVHENNERIADSYHGVGGELNVADQVQHNPMSKAFVRAAQEAGIPFTPDPNGAEQEGVFYHQVTQRNAVRESASTAFLHPVIERSNLTVLTHAEVLKVNVKEGRAIGVQIRRGKQIADVFADREVILSSGAFNSPRLLQLSGIGDAEYLSKIGITPVHDLKGVGENLHDQLEVYITAKCAEPVSYDGQGRTDRALRHLLQWKLYKTGPATATITEAGAFIKSSEDVPSPDIQLHMLPAYVVWEDLARSAQKVPGHGITILACNIRPRSRGSLKVLSSDPDVSPAIDPNYHADPHDEQVSVEGFKWIRRVLEAPAFQSHLDGEGLPGKSVQTDEQIRDFIRRYAKTDYHPVGTCKMGVDDMAVVDPRLKVYGLEGLRVIDSSIMPAIISGNTQAPSMMIGEKGAAMVLEDA